MHRFARLLSPLLLSLSLLSLPDSVDAMTMLETELECPIGGEKFTTKLAGSGTQYGQFLDRRPFGPTPSPWPLAKCPGNGFVMFKHEFSAEELAVLTPYVESAEYREMQAKESTYFLAASLLRELGLDDATVANTLLRATWQVENGADYSRYAEATLAALDAAIATPAADIDAESLLNFRQIAGELERRLGRLEAAKARFDALATEPGLSGTPLQAVVAQEMALVAAGDTATHRHEPPAPPAAAE
jgi:hypothetical protein